MGFGNFVLAIIYFGCAIGAINQCCNRKDLSNINIIRRYFNTSLLFGCLVRSSAFATVFIISQTNSALTSFTGRSCLPLPSTSTASDQQKAIHLFSKVLFVLTNLPDMMIMSSFALFFLVWMEVFQASRLHWHSEGRSRRRWMFYYLLFNVILYSLQVVLYGLIFFGHDDSPTCKFFVVVVCVCVCVCFFLWQFLWQCSVRRRTAAYGGAWCMGCSLVGFCMTDPSFFVAASVSVHR